MKFKTQGQVKDHIKGHYDLKPYICHICLAKFTRNSSLKVHFNIHTDIKPYKCPECTKTFYDKTQIRFHMKKHYPDCMIEEKFREYLISNASEINQLIDLRKLELKTKSKNKKPIKPNYPKYIKKGNTYEVEVSKPKEKLLSSKRRSDSNMDINVPIDIMSTINDLKSSIYKIDNQQLANCITDNLNKHISCIS